MFKNMGGIIPGGNFLDGNFSAMWGGGGIHKGEFDGWEFSVRESSRGKHQ